MNALVDWLPTQPLAGSASFFSPSCFRPGPCSLPHLRKKRSKGPWDPIIIKMDRSCTCGPCRYSHFPFANFVIAQSAKPWYLGGLCSFSLLSHTYIFFRNNLGKPAGTAHAVINNSHPKEEKNWSLGWGSRGGDRVITAGRALNAKIDFLTSRQGIEAGSS